MRKMSMIALLLPLAAAAQDQEVGRVLSSTPIVQQVAVPQQFCGTQQIVTQAPRTGAGAVMGAIAGGAVGNGIGGGSGRALATAIGVMGGAVVGDQIEGGGATQVQNVRQCTTQTVYESRTVGYDVVYEYAGRQYRTQMAQDPGPTVALQVSAVGAQSVPAPEDDAPAPAGYGTISSYTTYVPPPPAVYAPAPVMAYPGYEVRPYPAPVGMSLNFRYSNRH